jgi:hypothetical protein
LQVIRLQVYRLWIDFIWLLVFGICSGNGLISKWHQYYELTGKFSEFLKIFIRGFYKSRRLVGR